MYNTQELDRVWDALIEYMDDDIREKVHEELAPCTSQLLTTLKGRSLRLAPAVLT